MMAGHIAAGFVGKRFAPTINLGWLIAAGAIVDTLMAVLILADVEHARIVPGFTAANALDLYDFGWSHSLLTDLVWAAAVGLLWWAWRKSKREAVVVGAVVFSHWALDLITHIPDLPLWPGSDVRLGFGLWRSVAATIAVEGALWLVALALYVRASRASNARGSFGFWIYALLVSAMFLLSFGGEPPPNMQVVAYMSLGMVLLLLLPAWADRHRRSAAT